MRFGVRVILLLFVGVLFALIPHADVDQQVSAAPILQVGGDVAANDVAANDVAANDVAANDVAANDGAANDGAASDSSTTSADVSGASTVSDVGVEAALSVAHVLDLNTLLGDSESSDEAPAPTSPVAPQDAGGASEVASTTTAPAATPPDSPAPSTTSTEAPNGSQESVETEVLGVSLVDESPRTAPTVVEQVATTAPPTTPAPTTAAPTTTLAPATVAPVTAAPGPAAPATAAQRAVPETTTVPPTTVPETTVPPTTVPPTTVPPTTAPPSVAEQMLALVNFDWQRAFPDWTVEFYGERTGIRGLTYPAEKRVEIFIRSDDTPASLLRIFTHELGHVIDVELNSNEDRRRWVEQRGISADAPWWPGSEAPDFATGAGDFAETFAVLQTGIATRSTVAGQPTSADLALMRELVAG